MVARSDFQRVSRRDERGAAVFIVVMVITLLTAIGIFAARSASMVDMASGYERQASQAMYVSEYGGIATLAHLGSGTAQVYVQQMDSGSDDCRANIGLPANPRPACYKIFKNEIEGNTVRMANEAILEPSSPTESGSFGPLSNVMGDFVVEMTDKAPAGMVAGMDLAGVATRFGYVKVALTSTAQIRPLVGMAFTCTQGVAAVTGQQSMRMNAIVGPLYRNE